MKILLFICIMLYSLGTLHAQGVKIYAADVRALKAKEDTLKNYSLYLNTDSMQADRMVSDSIFTKTLVRALQIRNSFYFPFDSVIGVSHLYSPDSSFRIFSWNISYDDYYQRQRGAIQMKTADGSLKLIPLRDYSEFTTKPEDSVRTRANWIGAIYYRIIRTQYHNKDYYTLFGFDPNGAQSSMKWIDVLSFTDRGEPQFGGPFFSYEQDSIPSPTKYRYGIEFKKDTRVLVNYIDDLGIILVDHLVSETDQPELAQTLIPDGDQEGFKWENGKWIHVDKVFTLKLKDGDAPVGDPLLDPKGNRNEQKLQEKSDKNRGKEKDKVNDGREN